MSERKVILVVVDVRSAHNVGSIFRTCDGFGAEVVLVGITPRPLTRDDRLPHIAKKAHAKITKTALGAENTVPWRYFSDWQLAYSYLHTLGSKIIAIEQSERSLPLSELPKTIDIALVVGPEVQGLEKNILDDCEYVYEIPMNGNKESFNVSVAAGIALYQTTL